MIKALFVSLGLVIVFVTMYFMNVYSFLAERAVFWTAVGILVITLGAAILILGLPFTKNGDDDRDED